MNAPGSLAVPAPLAAVLRAERELFNEKFAAARRRRPDLDGRAFAAFLRGPATRVVESAAPAAGERVREVAHAAYDAALTLIGEKLAGLGGRHRAIDETWERLLPALATLVADQPVRTIGSLTNAVLHLSVTPGARPLEWIDRLIGTAPLLASVPDLLRAGQVAAWRTGLAHLRERALAAGDRLRPELAAALVGAPRAEWSELREHLRRDQWWDPDPSAAHAQGERRPRIAAAAGGFRGFGGLFAVPPTVGAVEGRLVVTAAGERWLLAADAFGATLHRIGPGAPGAGEAGGVPPVALPAIGAVTSIAVVPGTVAVTGALTHAVTLIAMPPGEGG